MMLPRNMSGDELVGLLRRHYGYRVVRQRSSHMRLATNVRGREHQVSVPRHSALKVGTLQSVFPGLPRIWKSARTNCGDSCSGTKG